LAIAHGRGGRGEEDFHGTGVARHLDDLAAGGATHDGVVDEQHALAAEFLMYGVEFLAHGILAHRLPRHDEGAADVAVLHEAFAVG